MAEALTSLERALRGIASALGDADQRWALVGGLAVSTRAEPRTTRDIDVVVDVPDDGAAEALVHRLQRGGYRLRTLLEHGPSGRIATVRLSTAAGPDQHILIDLLFASSGVETEIAAQAETLEILEGLNVPVATVGHLVALKVLARDDRYRPQDADDIRALLREADQREIERARAALDLITARGFSRGKALRAELELALADRST
jgi:predicted nucleotidyltransferase